MENNNINQEDIEKVEAVCNGATLALMLIGAATVGVACIKVGRGIGHAVLWNHDRRLRKQMMKNQETVIDV
jgi:hypothetical protein